MAPPIPGLRQPVAIRRRTPADVAISIAAVLALLVLTIGVPVALVTVVGLPIPHSMPKMSALTKQLDITAILRILSVIVWLAWIQLVWCVLVEIKASVSEFGVASKVPMAGATQSLAHRLVMTALLMFTAAASLTPAFAHSAPPRPAHSVSAEATPGARIDAILSHTAVAAHTPTSDKIYVVKPPVGRYHESLWEIASKHLGDGRRYKEIFELNKEHVQPDGTKLTIASLIRPGWVLHMPKDAHGPGIEIVAQHGQHGQHQASGETVEQAARLDGPAISVPGLNVQLSAPVTAAAQHHAWPYELSSASLMAAGVLVALGRRRREQLWRRAFGRRLGSPGGDAALAEQALRLGADDPAVRMLDTGLRHLSQQLAAQQKTPPTVFAAHIGTDNLDLWIAPPDPQPPRPWQATDGGQVWRLPVSAVAGLDPGSTLAPYPGLVSLGTNASGRVLVDLEVAHGLIAVRGPRPMVQAALAALAVELVTNVWSDRMHVTLVGFGEGLQNLATERLSVLPTLDEALPRLEARAAELTGAMSAGGFDSVLTGRSQTSDPDTWAPHYLIMGVPPTPAQAERLLALAKSRYRMAMGYVIAGDVPGATWAWDLTEDGRLRADALGFDLAAQLLAPEQYAALVELFRAVPGGVPLSPLGQGNAPPDHLVPGARLPVEIGLLGPATIEAPGSLESDRLALATELVVFLAAHPGGVHLNVLAGAVWPRGVSAEVRDAALARVSAWLGTGPGGEPNLQTDPSGRLRLGPGVRVDWLVFRALMNRASQAAAAAGGLGQSSAAAGGLGQSSAAAAGPGQSSAAAAGPGQSSAATAAEIACLEQALNLVRGQFLDGRDPARYAWLATDDVGYEVTALVADAAHRLSTLRLAQGDAAAAMEAARAGLRLSFNDEMLWRDLLIAAHATGKEGVLRAAVAEVSTRVALDEVMPKMAPETEALIDELLPSWRTTAA